jgi:DNA-binding NarL/FixJ family response regulator
LPELLSRRAAVNQRSDRPLTSTPHAALTERQREIVALVAEGLTNQAIADQLGLERLRVSEHVATILWQLDLKRRHEITAWAMAQNRRG